MLHLQVPSAVHTPCPEQSDGHEWRTTLVQSRPEKPGSQWHCSPSHRPCPAQLFGHAASTSAHALPVNPRSHTHCESLRAGAMQRPWPEHPYGQSARQSATAAAKASAIRMAINRAKMEKVRRCGILAQRCAAALATPSRASPSHERLRPELRLARARTERWRTARVSTDGGFGPPAAPTDRAIDSLMDATCRRSSPASLANGSSASKRA